MADQPEVDGHRMFIMEEDERGRYGFCEMCADHHDMVQYRLDGTGTFEPRVKCYPSCHAWRSWRKGNAIFRVAGV